MVKIPNNRHDRSIDTATGYNEKKDIFFHLQNTVKKLNCLYSISKIAESDALSLDTLMSSIVNIIPSGFQDPSEICTLAKVDNISYKTHPFKKSPFKLTSVLRVRKKKVGHLAVYLTRHDSPSTDTPFQNEEKTLLDAIAQRIGKIMERLQTEQELKEIETRYQILTDRFADGIVIIQNKRLKFVNNSFASMIGYTSTDEVLNKKLSLYIQNDFLPQYLDSLQKFSSKPYIQETIEYCIFSKNAEEIWVEEKRNRISWNGYPALLCILRNINEKKEREKCYKKEAEALRSENIRLRSSLKERYRFHNIIGRSKAMQYVYDLILSAANSDANVAIYGESGTGKEMVAKAIHELSPRKGNAFVTVNCGAIPELLLESEFFGYRKGAFTGALINKHGFLDLASNGTLFLDEIGELSMNMQAKLLRAIDGGGYNPIGGQKNNINNFRIISATNRVLKEEVHKGNMREDFYYRIHVIPLVLPPLRHRKEDIPLLVEHFTSLYSPKSQFSELPDIMLKKLNKYDWPGNVRELQNVIIRFFSTGESPFLEDNSIDMNTSGNDIQQNVFQKNRSLSELIDLYEKKQILNVLQKNNWQKIKAAQELGISRYTLFRKIKKHDLESTLKFQS